MKRLYRPVSTGVLLGTFLFLASASTFAHHSAAAEFDINKPITLKGTITRMDWLNPHSWLYIDVKGPDGKVVNWALELAGPNQLLRRGWRKTDLPIGTEVTITGYVAKQSVFINATATTRNVTLPDGKVLFAGPAEPGADGAR